MKPVTIQNRGDRGDSLNFLMWLPKSWRYGAHAHLMNISRLFHYVIRLFVIELRFGSRRTFDWKFIESCVEEKNNAKNSMNGTKCNQNVALAFKCSRATTQKVFFDIVSAESQLSSVRRRILIQIAGTFLKLIHFSTFAFIHRDIFAVIGRPIAC